MNILYISLTRGKGGIQEVHDVVQKVAQEQRFSFNSTILMTNKNLEPVDFYKEMELAKKTTDLLITDITFNSSGIGHDVLWALINRKPTLMLYDKKSREVSSLLINKSKKERLLFAEGYSHPTEIPGIIENFVRESNTLRDTKFILIISPEIDRYLEWAAESRRMHKAQVVRNAVEDAMSKDKEYKAFLKSQGLD